MSKALLASGFVHSTADFVFSYGSPSQILTITAIHLTGLVGGSAWSGKTVEIKYGTITLFKTSTMAGSSTIVLDELFIPISNAIGGVLTVLSDVTLAEGGLNVSLQYTVDSPDTDVYPVMLLNQNVTNTATTLIEPPSLSQDRIIVKSIFANNKSGGACNFRVGKGDDAAGKPTHGTFPIAGNGNLLLSDLKINYGYQVGDADNLKIELNGSNNVDVTAFGYYIKNV